MPETALNDFSDPIGNHNPFAAETNGFLVCAKIFEKKWRISKIAQYEKRTNEMVCEIPEKSLKPYATTKKEKKN